MSGWLEAPCTSCGERRPHCTCRCCGIVSWAWKTPQSYDLDLLIRGERLRVYIPEQYRKEVAESLERLADAIRPLP